MPAHTGFLVLVKTINKNSKLPVTDTWVSKLWHVTSKKVQKSRRAISWFTYSCEDQHDVNDPIRCYFDAASSIPKNTVVFCSSRLSELGVRVSECTSNKSMKQPPRKAKKKTVRIKDFVSEKLPKSCKLYGPCTDGVVGTTWEGKVQEHEGTGVLSCLMLPNIPGFDVYGFYKDNEELSSDDEMDDVNVTEYFNDGIVNRERLHQVTGVPDDKKIRLLLLFDLAHSNSTVKLIDAVIKTYGNVVIAGGVVDSFFTETLNDIEDGDNSVEDKREPSLHGIAFCGSDDNLQVASAVISSSDNDAKQIEDILKSLKMTHISEKKSVAFMFACIGRGKYFHHGNENVESKLFRKHFPNTPLFGFFGNGEIGFNYLPDYSTADGDKHYRPSVSDNNFGNGHFHAYCSIFVVLSFTQSKQ